jgi:Uma2 family endonuclease
MVTTRLTLEEFLRLPEEKPALEYMDGMVTQKVPPKGRHCRLQLKLTDFFSDFAEPSGLAIALQELRTTYAGWSPVPDVAVYLWDRIPWDATGEVPDDYYEPPDIAVEIVSPEQSRAGLVRKCEWYMANGVSIALLVDLDRRTVRLFRPGEPSVLLPGADVIDFAPVLPSLRLMVDDLFGWLRPRRQPTP